MSHYGTMIIWAKWGKGARNELAGRRNCTGVDPLANQFGEFFTRHRHRFAYATGMPAPSDEFVVRHMLVQLLEGTLSVSSGVLQHFGELVIVESFPGHRKRGQAPV